MVKLRLEVDWFSFNTWENKSTDWFFYFCHEENDRFSSIDKNPGIGSPLDTIYGISSNLDRISGISLQLDRSFKTSIQSDRKGAFDFLEKRGIGISFLQSYHLQSPLTS